MERYESGRYGGYGRRPRALIFRAAAHIRMSRDFEFYVFGRSGDVARDSFLAADLILEYGSGGSTLFAAEHGKTILTVESDPKWLGDLMAACQARSLPGSVTALLAEIGDTADWGYPENEARWREWPEYALLPWRTCEKGELQPDLVFIDGRFRVACFIAACVFCKRPTRLLFDDFGEREHYHIVRDLFEPVEIIENRLAVFEIVPGRVSSRFLLENYRYLFAPE